MAWPSTAQCLWYLTAEAVSTPCFLHPRSWHHDDTLLRKWASEAGQALDALLAQQLSGTAHIRAYPRVTSQKWPASQIDQRLTVGSRLQQALPQLLCMMACSPSRIRSSAAHPLPWQPYHPTLAPNFVTRAADLQGREHGQLGGHQSALERDPDPALAGQQLQHAAHHLVPFLGLPGPLLQVRSRHQRPASHADQLMDGAGMQSAGRARRLSVDKICWHGAADKSCFAPSFAVGSPLV